MAIATPGIQDCVICGKRGSLEIKGGWSRDGDDQMFIGIKSTDVYESDIIIFDNTDIGGGVTTGEVIWNDDLSLCGLGWHLWVIETSIPKCHSGFMGMDWLGSIKIIGSTHLTPELIP